MWHSSPRHQRHSLPWGHPCAPDLPAPSQPLPYILQVTQRTTFTPVSGNLQSVRHFEANLGGLAGQTSLLRMWLHILTPDVVTLQELWDFDGLEEVLPPYMTLLTGTVVGQGRGLAVAWRRTLCIPGFKAVPARDTREDLAVVLDTRQYGRLLVISTHMPPNLPDLSRHAIMRDWATLGKVTDPRYSLTQGDFNMSCDQGTPLEQALRPEGALAAYTPVLPRGTATHQPTSHTTPPANILQAGQEPPDTHQHTPRPNNQKAALP